MHRNDAVVGRSVVLDISEPGVIWIRHTGQPRTMLGTPTDSWQSRMAQQHHCMHSRSMPAVSQILWYHQCFLVQPSLLQQLHGSARPCARWVASLALQQQQLWVLGMGAAALQALNCAWVSSCSSVASASASPCPTCAKDRIGVCKYKFLPPSHVPLARESALNHADHILFVLVFSCCNCGVK